MRVFLGVPTHDGKISARTALAMDRCGKIDLLVKQYTSLSLLANNFNSLVCSAYNDKEHRPEYFCMLHADVAPMDAGWLNQMIDILTGRRLDVLSVALPIKALGGLTSTALDRDPRPRRLTMHEIIHELPPTFGRKEVGEKYGNDRLLFNTGLLLWRMDAIDPKLYTFHIDDWILSDDAGTLSPFCQPEDWNFSRAVMHYGLKYAVTSAVKAEHVSSEFIFNNCHVWGAQHED